jgi:hypothetical protein
MLSPPLTDAAATSQETPSKVLITNSRSTITRSKENSLFDTTLKSSSLFDTEQLFLPYMTLCLKFVPYMTFRLILLLTVLNNT